MLEFINNTIGIYMFIVGIGAIVIFLVFSWLEGKRGKNWSERIVLFLHILFGIYFGAHLLYFFVQLPEWIEVYGGNIHSVSDFIDAFLVGASGLVLYGGVLSGLFMARVYSKRNFLSVRSELNCAVVVFPLFHVFGRIGCTFNGCCYGIEYHGPLAITYTEAYIVPGKSDDVADFSRFPVQPLEAVLGLALFIALFILYKKTQDKYPLVCVYLISYSIIRFLDEFLRADKARGIWGPFSTSQWLSMIIFVVCVIYLFVLRSRFRKMCTGQFF